MTDSLGFFVVIGAAWLAIGLVLSIVMGRRGHDSFSWLLLGTVLGPLAVVLAVEAGRHDERLRPAPVGAGTPVAAGNGPVDVLVGYDGSPQSTAAIDAVAGLLGDRLGRLMVTTVIPYGQVREPERLATEALRSLIGRVPGRIAPVRGPAWSPVHRAEPVRERAGLRTDRGRLAGRGPHPRRAGQRSHRAGPRQQGPRAGGRRLRPIRLPSGSRRGRTGASRRSGGRRVELP